MRRQTERLKLCAKKANGVRAATQSSKFGFDARTRPYHLLFRWCETSNAQQKRILVLAGHDLTMSKLLGAAVFGFLLAGCAAAAPPTCKTVEHDGTTFNQCQRTDAHCDSLAAEQVNDPSRNWNGCRLPALITKYYVAMPAIGMTFITHVFIVPSYRDSERVDMTVTIEQPDHTFRTYERKDVPVIIEKGISNAIVDILTTAEPVGVPTVEAKEKGGKKEAMHDYR